MTATLSRPSGPETHPLADTAVADLKRPWLPWAFMTLSLVLFASGVGSIKSASSVKSEWGLLGTASPAWAMSFIVAVLAFVVAVRHRNVKAVMWVTIVMGICVHLPKSIANDFPMFAWTYKHLGVTDYIQHAQALAPGIDIYMGWPGLFATTAWFCDLTGISSTTFAHYWTPSFHALMALMVFGAARVWNLDPLRAATASFLVVTFNWVQQDYFSGQAMVMLFLPGILIILGLSRKRPVGTALLLVLFSAAAITHQLTPFWIYGAIGLLVLTRQFKPWWILVPLGLMLVGQLIYNWDEVSRYPLFSTDLLDNATTNLAKYNLQPVIGQRVVSYGNKVLAAFLWGGTALTLLYRMRKKMPFWALGVVSLSPMLVLGGQGYGGEAVFRVYLYSIIGCSIVLAPVIVNALQRPWKVFTAFTATMLLATTIAVNGETAAWYAFVIPKAQVETAKQVLAQAELPAYLTSAAPTWPERTSWRYVDYVRFSKGYDAPMIYRSNLANRKFDNDRDYRVFVEALNSRPDASTYLIITDQMQVYCWYFGILPWEALPNLKKYLYRDTVRWQPFYDGQGVTVFVHKVAPEENPDIGAPVLGRPAVVPPSAGGPPPGGAPVPPVGEPPQSVEVPPSDRGAPATGDTPAVGAPPSAAGDG